MRVTSPLVKVLCFLMVGACSLMALAQTPTKTSTKTATAAPATQYATFVNGAKFALPAQPTSLVTIYGMDGMTLDESTLSYAVASKGADGKISFQCVEGKDKVKMTGPQTTASKEKLDEK